jgi:NAD(P)-dependent dehydrogenase (short-subunit alcohol dehydrogenase family)
VQVSLAGKRVLVIGGSSGIGLATAQAAAGLGAEVTIASRSRDKLETAKASINGRVTARPLDTTDDAAVEAFLGGAEVYDHVLVSAAATKTGKVRELSLEDAYASMGSKFWGAYRVARAAPISPDGSLTLISGGLSRRPRADSVLQGSINAAVEALGRGLALELAPVRVNTVSPGFVDTPLWDKLPAEARRARIDAAAARLPVRRAGAAEDIAHAIIMVMTNRYLTGSTIVVDGGGAIA